MNLEFDSKDLEKIYTTQISDLPRKIVKQYSRKIIRDFITFCNVVELYDFSYLSNIKGYNVEKLKGDRKGQWSARLNKQFRVIFTYDETTDTLTIIEISKHYE